jgi:hypothetical protein
MPEFHFIYLISTGLSSTKLARREIKRFELNNDIGEFAEAFELMPSGVYPVVGLTCAFETGKTTACASFFDRGGKHKNGTVFLMSAEDDERRGMVDRIRGFTNLDLPSSPLAVLIQYDADPTLEDGACKAAGAFFYLTRPWPSGSETK